MSPERTQPASADDRHSIRWMMLGLAVVTLVIFWRATACGFINYDDPEYVAQNPYVQQGLTPESFRWAFTSRHEGLWIPLTSLSHMVDWQLYGNNPAGHHLTNVLLHVANTLLLFLLLRRMTGSHWRSALVAALFALHPLHVESVAWISERKGVLSTWFGLLTLYAYASYVQFRVQGLTIRAVISHVTALVLFAIGLLAKPMLVTLPLVMLLLDYWPLERWTTSTPTPAGRTGPRWRGLVVEKMPFFLLAALFGVLTAGVAPESSLTLGQRIGNALIACPRYLWKTVWPAVLAIPYPHPWNWPIWQVALAAAFLAATTFWVLRHARQHPCWITGWFWFLITLAPVLGLVRMGVYSIADRYTYIPLIGIFVMVVWTAGDTVMKRWSWKPAAGMPAALLLALCAWQTHDQLGYWTDSGALFSHATAVTDNNCIAHTNLGYYFQNKGRLDEAIRHYAEAVKIWPQYDTAVNNLFNAQTLQNAQRNRKAGERP